MKEISGVLNEFSLIISREVLFALEKEGTEST
jgi:hypothetical protein